MRAITITLLLLSLSSFALSTVGGVKEGNTGVEQHVRELEPEAEPKKEKGFMDYVKGSLSSLFGASGGHEAGSPKSEHRSGKEIPKTEKKGVGKNMKRKEESNGFNSLFEKVMDRLMKASQSVKEWWKRFNIFGKKRRARHRKAKETTSTKKAHPHEPSSTENP
ncbi:hypothetical protein V3C99_008874 [Haemonchus contortus]